MAPLAASSPHALPPESMTACTCCTRLEGCSRSVSRVPGAAPRTSQPPTAPPRASTTVQPVGAAGIGVVAYLDALYAGDGAGV